MAPNKVILLACGSFNPPTNMHLRMFELARDNLNRLGQFLVIGGIISPVHDAYGKKELIPSSYRCEMVKLALKSSDWIQISDWECSQECWFQTRKVLQYHQNMLNAVLNEQSDSPNNNLRSDKENGYDCSSWITNDIRNTQGPIQIKLLCGADLLESFATPGLWAEEDIETIIGQHGLVVITRQGSNPQRFIYESDMLTKYQHNITIVTEWITNDVSSTKVRRALRRQESVKYLIQDSVIQFIKKHGLYGTVKCDFKYKTNLNEQLTVPINSYILTPSPSDINMMSSSSSGHDIYLTLDPLINKNLTEPDAALTKTNSQLFQSAAEMKLSNKEKSQTKPVQAREAAEVTSPEKRKKVGFSGKAKPGGENDAKEMLLCRKFSEKHTKSVGGKAIGKADGEKADNPSDSLLLRRSQSDAIMSKRSGEAVSVKIQFTKDGIKVISDKAVGMQSTSPRCQISSQQSRFAVGAVMRALQGRITSEVPNYCQSTENCSSAVIAGNDRKLPSRINTLHSRDDCPSPLPYYYTIS